ncbi:MAG: hypothetical protein M3Y25_03920 [Thermoproteota archaeon]|nr:hypothetical protein [Thermoproteota archaeon]
MIFKNGKDINLKLYDEDLKELMYETFGDIYTLNFYLQTLPKKFGQKKTLLIYSKEKNTSTQERSSYSDDTKIAQTPDNIQLIIAEDENSYFIEE